MDGLRIVPGYLDRPTQERLLAVLSDVFRQAPLYTPRMPKSGQPMSVQMTNCGPLGWVTDERGYRYEPLHPVTGKPWPETAIGVPTGPRLGVSASLPTKPPDGVPTAISGPSAAAGGAAIEAAGNASVSARSAQASVIVRPNLTPGIMAVPSGLRYCLGAAVGGGWIVIVPSTTLNCDDLILNGSQIVARPSASVATALYMNVPVGYSVGICQAAVQK